jgi:hypothetical protein
MSEPQPNQPQPALAGRHQQAAVPAAPQPGYHQVPNVPVPQQGYSQPPAQAHPQQGYPQAPGQAYPQQGYQQAPVRKQGAWGLWWLVIVTFGIYYYVWYARINKELASVLGIKVPANGMWWAQLIPIYNLVGLGSTAKRVNAAHAAVGSPTRVGVFVTWFWAPAWFGSQTRYLQRRINILHDVLAGRSAR